MFEQQYTKHFRIASGFDYKYLTIEYVKIRYESPNSILISGDLIDRNSKEFNSYLWQAMDLLKNKYGFELQEVMTTGIGAEGNPTVAYILMTK